MSVNELIAKVSRMSEDADKKYLDSLDGFGDLAKAKQEADDLDRLVDILTGIVSEE